MRRWISLKLDNYRDKSLSNDSRLILDNIGKYTYFG